MLSKIVHGLVLYIFVLSSHAVERDRKRIMRSSRGLQDEVLIAKDESTLARVSGVQTLPTRDYDSSQSHGNRSISETMKRFEDLPGVVPDARKRFARTEKKVPRQSPSVKRNIRSLHHHAREHIAPGGQVSVLSQHAVEATGAVAMEIESLPSTSPTAFVIQSSGAVDVSANPEASPANPEASPPHSYAQMFDAMQQAPTAPPTIQPTLPPVAAAAPQGTLPPVATGAPVAAAAPPPPAPANTTTTKEEGGSGFLGTFFMLLLVGVVLVGAAAVILKLRKDKNNSNSVGGRLGGLLAADSGDSQFWKSAKSRQSSRRSVGTPSETEEEASKSESAEDRKSKSSSTYKDRKSASGASNKNVGEDSEADTSRSLYKKPRSRAQSEALPPRETPKADEVDKQSSIEGDTGGKRTSTSQSETDVGAASTYRGRRNQLSSSRNESRSVSRSQSRSNVARQQSNTDIAV